MGIFRIQSGVQTVVDVSTKNSPKARGDKNNKRIKDKKEEIISFEQCDVKYMYMVVYK